VKLTAIILAAIAAFCGLLASWYWYQSSNVAHPNRLALLYGTLSSSDKELVVAGAMGLREAAADTAKLNTKAALWTAAAVILGTAGNLVSAFSN
jgi:hypothetical protein